jgi:uncharacterized protein (TIGR00369 family)
LKKDYAQGFISYCGFEATRLDDGVFEARFQVRPELKQQDGFVHAGVLATLADHTAGYSAYTVVPESVQILTIEFKINYFKPAVGPEIACRSRVINMGKRIIVAESEIYDCDDESERLVSKAIVTLAAIPITNSGRNSSSS